MLKNKPEEYKESYSKRFKKMKKTIQEKYGVDNVMQSNEVKESYKEKFISKYGVDNPMKVKEFRDNLMKTLECTNEMEEFETKNGKKYYRYKGYPISDGQYTFYQVMGGELNAFID